MKHLAFALVALLALAGCQTINDIDSGIQRSLPAFCQGAQTFHAGFTIAAAGGQMKPKLAAREASLWATLEPLCADPTTANSTTLVLTLMTAYVTVMKEAG